MKYVIICPKCGLNRLTGSVPQKCTRCGRKFTTSIKVGVFNTGKDKRQKLFMGSLALYRKSGKEAYDRAAHMLDVFRGVRR